MFCRQCGSEIPNEAKFCTFCGTKTVAPKPREDEGLDPRKAKESNTAPDKGAATDESAAQSTNGNATNTASETDEQSSTTATPEEPIAQANNTGETPEAESATNVAISAANEPTSVVATIGNASAKTGNATQEQSETSSLKAAVEQNKKRSRRRMPMILLVALALALATSVAYAAYRVYTDVWLPYQAEQEAQSRQSDNSVGSDGDAITGKTADEPENLLHIADILTMDPTQIGDYIESQGITPQRIAPTKHAMDGGFKSDKSFDAWVLTQDETNSIVTALDKDDKYLSSDYYDQTYTSVPPVLAVGDTAVPFQGISQSYYTAEDLKAGKKPSSITLTTLSLNGLSSDEFNSFLEYCGLGKPLASAKASKGGAPFCTSKVGIMEDQNGNKYLWYATALLNNDEYVSCTIGCMEIDTAYITLGISPSASASSSNPKDYWNNADNKTKSELVSRSILEHQWPQSYYGTMNISNE